MFILTFSQLNEKIEKFKIEFTEFEVNRAAFFEERDNIFAAEMEKIEKRKRELEELRQHLEDERATTMAIYEENSQIALKTIALQQDVREREEAQAETEKNLNRAHEILLERLVYFSKVILFSVRPKLKLI